MSTKTVDPPSPRYPWAGSLADFVEQFVAPWWPHPEKLAAWTDAAIQWHERSNPLLLLREHTDKGWLHEIEGQPVVNTDNSPGIWILLRARDGGAQPMSWPELVQLGRMPVLKARAAGTPDRPWTHARNALSNADANTLWSRQLKHCHVFGLRPSLGITLKQRSLRNVCLLNHFVFPNGLKHFRTTRDGWSEDPAPSDLGESPIVCAYVFHALLDRIRPVAPSLPERFLRAAGAMLPLRPSGALRIRIERRAAQPVPSQALDGTAATHTSTVVGAPPPGAKSRQWTLRRNNRAQHHGIVDLSESPLYLSLWWRADEHSEATHVGVFRLDLEGLLRGKYVRHDPAGSTGSRLRLRIVMLDDDSFHVQVGAGTPRYYLGRVR